MTEAEKNGIRARALERYMRAIDDGKAQCGLLSELVEVLRSVVNLYDTHSIQVAETDSGGLVFGHEAASGFTIPSNDAVVQSFRECQKARQEEHRLLSEALNAGVDKTVLDALTRGL